MPDKIFLRHESPETTVITAIAVVTHHEIVAFRHGESPGTFREFLSELQNLVINFAHLLRMGCCTQHQLLINRTDIGLATAHGHSLAIDDELTVLIDHRIARQADNAFDVVQTWILRVTEYRYITTFG